MTSADDTIKRIKEQQLLLRYCDQIAEKALTIVSETGNQIRNAPDQEIEAFKVGASIGAGFALEDLASKCLVQIQDVIDGAKGAGE